MRVLVTGSRRHKDVDLIYKALDDLCRTPEEPVVLVSGGAKGADRIAEMWARQAGWEVERHKADWKRHGQAAGQIRNREMIETEPDFIVAFPLPYGTGTRNCMNLGRKAGIPMRVWTRENGIPLMKGDTT